jgi:Predicted glycosyltransferases
LFSIIIPTYNRAAILERSLDSVCSMDGVDTCEILVVNDGSTDATASVLAAAASKYGNVRELRKQNSGPGEARNYALEQASFERILFLDDDIFPDPGLLAAHRQALEGSSDVSQGNMIWHEDLAGDEVIRFMDARGMQFRLDRYADGARLPYRNVYTANLAMFRHDAFRIGGFDKAFAARRYAFEDTAFAWRLEKGGCRITFTAAAKARHLHPMTEEGLLLRERAVGFGMAVARRRYPEIAKDFNFDAIMRFAKPQLALARMVEASGAARLFGRDFRRRLALRRAFLEGALDGAGQSGGAV